MVGIGNAWTARERHHFMRPDAHRFIRPDAWRFMPAGAPRLIGKDVVRYFWPNAKAHRRTQFERGDDVGAFPAECDALLKLKCELITLKAEIKLRQALAQFKAGFDPNQPRAPAGSREGGRWTSEGGTQVTTSPGFLTGISTIDDTSNALSDILLRVVENLNFIPESSPQKYGIAVHAAFAAAVQLQNLPGIGFWDVERTFSLDGSDPRYGLAGSIRTDVVLRNELGDIIAIYDVKTGGKPLSHARANELRMKTRAAENTPVFELNVVRGPSLKYSRYGR